MTTGLRNNGKAGTMRRLPVKVSLVELDGDYVGWSATMRTNPPMGLFGELTSGDMTRAKGAIAILVIDWNFVDEEGAPMPFPREGGLEKVPIDLLTVLLTSYTEHVRKASEIPKDSKIKSGLT